MSSAAGNNYGLTDKDWWTNSAAILFSDRLTPGIKKLFEVEIALGVIIIVHSFIIKRFRFDKIRIANDIGALCMMLQGIFFSLCVSEDLDPVCPLHTQVIYTNILGNMFFSAIIQICDVYVTFCRYDVIVGGASVWHKRLAFLWVFFFVVFNWVPFMSIFPIFANMNSDFWMELQFIICQWEGFAAYVVYDLFYISLVLYEVITKMTTTESITKKINYKLRNVCVRAALHSLFSLIGIFLVSFLPSIGIALQTLIISVALHVFLNWNKSHLLFSNKAFYSTEMASTTHSSRFAYMTRFSAQVFAADDDDDENDLHNMDKARMKASDTTETTGVSKETFVDFETDPPSRVEPSMSEKSLGAVKDNQSQETDSPA